MLKKNDYSEKIQIKYVSKFTPKVLIFKLNVET
jgi:hypothetical protein